MLNPDGSFNYEANAGQTGADAFEFRANDGLADSNTATVSIEIEASDAPAVSCHNENPAVPATTPSSDFTIHDDGTVTHDTTGLTWMRCSLGQTWDAGSETCTGSADQHTWFGALDAARELNESGGYAGQMDWRLPNKNELFSITEGRCWLPAANLAIFPETAAVSFWTASPRTLSADMAWSIGFARGETGSTMKWAPAEVRLVRAGD